jgi:hypothetical protein
VIWSLDGVWVGENGHLLPLVSTDTTRTTANEISLCAHYEEGMAWQGLNIQGSSSRSNSMKQ